MADNTADLDKELNDVEYEKPASKQGRRQGSYVGDKSTSFRDFFLKPELEKAIKEAGFEHPSQVQQECIPTAILGDDFICQGKSGMGKTLIFVLAILHNIGQNNGKIKALVIAPAKELAIQITKEFQRFMEPEKKKWVFCMTGGYPNSNILSDLRERQPCILVCTPGKCRDLIDRKKLSLDEVRFFVIDEVDQVFEDKKGRNNMKDDVDFIQKHLPSRKQVMLLSATMDDNMLNKIRRYAKNPKEVLIDSDSNLTLDGIKQRYLKLEENAKTRKLIEIIENIEYTQAIIFVSSIERCNKLNEILKDRDYDCITLHSDMNPDERTRNYNAFKEYKHRILVATNLVARGIDIERVNLVVNYDMPDKSDTYLHRVARSGRFGTNGIACSFVSKKEDEVVLEETQNRFEVKMDELKEPITKDSFNA